MKIVQPIRQVTINNVHNGYIVSVGCQTFVFQDKDEMFALLREYIDDGRKMEDRIMKPFYEKTGSPVPCDVPEQPSYRQAEQQVAATCAPSVLSARA